MFRHGLTGRDIQKPRGRIAIGAKHRLFGAARDGFPFDRAGIAADELAQGGGEYAAHRRAPLGRLHARNLGKRLFKAIGGQFGLADVRQNRAAQFLIARKADTRVIIERDMGCDDQIERLGQHASGDALPAEVAPH